MILIPRIKIFFVGKQFSSDKEVKETVDESKFQNNIIVLKRIIDSNTSTSKKIISENKNNWQKDGENQFFCTSSQQLRK